MAGGSAFRAVEQEQEQEQEREVALTPFTPLPSMLGYRLDDAEPAVSVA
jgi:hypothetical protein